MRYIKSPSESVSPGNVNRFKMSYTHVRGTQSASLSLKKQDAYLTAEGRTGPVASLRKHFSNPWAAPAARSSCDTSERRRRFQAVPLTLQRTEESIQLSRRCCGHRSTVPPSPLWSFITPGLDLVNKSAVITWQRLPFSHSPGLVGRTEQLTSRKCSVTVCYFVPGLGRLENSPSKQSLLPISSLPFPQNLNSGILPWGFIENSPSGIFCWQKVSNWCQPEKTQPPRLLNSRKVWAPSQGSREPGRAANASKAPAPSAQSRLVRLN